MNEITAVVKTLSFKKKAIIALCALVGVVAIVASSVLATVAYLTSSASVINSFTVGNVQIKLDESVVLPDGTLDPNRTGERVQSNTYNLIPGAVYIKDPTLHVLDGSTSSYLFITVRNDLKAIANTTSDTDEIYTIAEQLKANGWAEYKDTAVGTVYAYVGTGKMTPDGKILGTATVDDVELSQVGSYPLFTHFSIDPDIKDEELKHYTAAKIIINAFAIQEEGFLTVGDAWNALEADYGDIIGFNGSTINS